MSGYVNIFGENVDPPGEADAEPGKRKDTKPNGYAWTPGTGPQGETCSTCAHLVRRQWAKAYLKCALNKANWTKGRGSDVLARSPACRHWERTA